MAPSASRMNVRLAARKASAVDGLGDDAGDDIRVAPERLANEVPDDRGREQRMIRRRDERRFARPEGTHVALPTLAAGDRPLG